MLVLAEVSLWTYSVFLKNTSSPSLSTDISADTSGKILNVLILGESTSTAFGVKSDESWPQQMKSLASEHDIQLNIRNISQVAITTKYLVDRTIALIPNYRPDVVISMMGINDALDEKLLRKNSAQANLDLKRSRVYRLLASLFQYHFQNSSLRKVDSKDSINGSQRDLIDSKGFQLKMVPNDITDIGQLKLIKAFMTGFRSLDLNLRLLALKNFLSRFPEKEMQNRLLAHIISNELDLSHTSPQAASVLIDIFTYFFDTYEKSTPGAFAEFLLIADNNRSYDQIIRVIKIVTHKKIPISPVALGRLSYILRRETVYNALPETTFNHYGYTKSELLKITNTVENYQSLARLLKKNRICFIAATYPTQTPDELIGIIFKNQQPIRPDIVVDQSQSFLKALKTQKYDELFIDSFGGGFGHTTAKGHRLIAENIFKAIQRLPSQCTP